MSDKKELTGRPVKYKLPKELKAKDMDLPLGFAKTVGEIFKERENLNFVNSYRNINI